MHIDNISEWVIHVDSSNKEYVTGFRNNSTRIYETSDIITKIPLRNSILIITENESVYRLPYYSFYD
jgi:hypothetical protein